jgi:hypothetical protein
MEHLASTADLGGNDNLNWCKTFLGDIIELRRLAMIHHMEAFMSLFSAKEYSQAHTHRTIVQLLMEQHRAASDVGLVSLTEKDKFDMATWKGLVEESRKMILDNRT